MKSARENDCLIVGAGAIGVSIALELARRGREVLLVERGSELAWGCSSGSAGLICPSHAPPLPSPQALTSGLRWMLRRDSPLYLKPRLEVIPWLVRFAASSTRARARAGTDLIRVLSQSSLELHAEHASRDGADGFARRGILNVFESEAGFARGRQEASEHVAAGLRAEVLDGAQARALEPALSATPVGAVYFPDEAHCDPRAYVNSVGRAAEDAGVRLMTDVEVLGFRFDGERASEAATTAGPLGFRELVLATGAWTAKLARALGLRLPIEGGKGYHVDVELAPDALGIPLFIHEPRVVATPLDGRMRISGTLELAGLDRSVDPVRLRAIVEAAERHVGALASAPVVDVWRGLRPCAPDGLPLIGRPARWENVHVATGHAQLGLTLAPVTGVALAEMIVGDRPTYDVRALHPDRFRGRRRERAVFETRRVRWPG